MTDDPAIGRPGCLQLRFGLCQTCFRGCRTTLGLSDIRPGTLANIKTIFGRHFLTRQNTNIITTDFGRFLIAPHINIGIGGSQEDALFGISQIFTGR